MTHTETERNLLFGLLALQVGLVDQDRLIAAFRTWGRDKARPLDDLIAGGGGLDAEQRALVDGLVAQHLKKHGGSVEKSLAALDVGPSTRASLARLGDRDVEASLAQLAPAATRADGELTATYSVGSATSDGQRFRILRPHARGGLGAVFVALDAELHREVALKQILEKHADDAVSRQRFLLEAEITGALEHPGVVPVYGLGADAGGRPYYAMRFINGDSLKDAIARFHERAESRELELRRLLRRFLDACNAIDYAHSRGVIHRDVKPANIIVGKHGETLVVDWGLAKAVGRADPSVGEQTLAPSSGGSSETLPGSALGTPAYMSPEQARGDLESLGPRSDVYGLGATLYCLLTGKPPFEGDDVGGILRAVQAGQFRRPSQLDSTLDKALEAVCLKAMATGPEDRYPTPRGLADDLERWMADEPVTAWREPFSRRARRWARRNRTAVTALAASVLVALAGTAAVLGVQTQANGRLQDANRELMIANGRVARANTDLKAANDREKQRFILAMDAIKLFHGEVSEDLLLKEKRFERLRTKLLKGAADFYGRLEDHLKGQADRVSRAALGRAYDELGELTARIGDQSAALAVHRNALAVRRTLAAEPGADVESQLDVARSLLAVGVLLGATSRPDAAMDAFREARSLSEGLTELSPDSRSIRCVLAYSLYRIGAMLDRGKRPTEALTAFASAQRVFQELSETKPGDIQAQRGLAWCENDIGNLLDDEGKASEALAAYERSRRAKQRIAEEHPGDAEYQRDLAIAPTNIGRLLDRTGRPTEALAMYERARALLQRAADENPAVTPFQLDLAACLTRIGWLLDQTGDPAGALAAYGQALAIQQKLAHEHPDVAEFQADVANNLVSMGWLLLQRGKPDESIDYFSREAAIRKTLADDNPTVPSYRAYLANCHTNTANALLRLGKPAEARARCERAVALCEVLVGAHPEVPEYRRRLAESLLWFGRVRQAQGDVAGAAADWTRSVALYRTVPDPDGECLFFYACSHASLSSLAGLPDTGLSADEGDAEADRAMALLRRAAGVSYRVPYAYRNEPALEPLRGRDDFRLMMLDLAFPQEPFARSENP